MTVGGRVIPKNRIHHYTWIMTKINRITLRNLMIARPEYVNWLKSISLYLQATSDTSVSPWSFFFRWILTSEEYLERVRSHSFQFTNKKPKCNQHLFLCFLRHQPILFKRHSLGSDVSDHFFWSEYRVNRTRFHWLSSEFSLYWT